MVDIKREEERKEEGEAVEETDEANVKRDQRPVEGRREESEAETSGETTSETPQEGGGV